MRYKLILILFFLSFCNICHANTIDGIQAWWKFEEATGTNSFDSSWKGNVGTVTNSPNSVTNCSRSNCLNFASASSQYVDIAGLTSNTLFLNATFTMSVWFKTSTASFQVLIGKGASASGDLGGFQIAIDLSATSSGLFCFRTKSDAGAETLRRDGTTNYADGLWHHGVAVVTTSTSGTAGQNIQLYVDGALNQGALTNAAASGTSTSSVQIARRPSGTYFNGQLDDVRIYNRALTVQEVKDLYNSGIKSNYAPGI